MPDTVVIGGQTFVKGQKLAAAGHAIPGYMVKWGRFLFTFFDTRADMVDWFQRARGACLSTEPKQAFMPLEVVYEGQRCGFYADIECITPQTMPTGPVDTLKADIVRFVNRAYDARGLNSGALLWSENHRGQKISFHVVGRDVDFEGSDGESDLAHVAKKMNWDCLELTKEYPDVEFSLCGRTGKKQNLFDLRVYSWNRAMRTIYSSKEGSTDSCFMPCAGFEGREVEEWWIVRDVGSESERPVHTEPWEEAVDGPKFAHTKGWQGKKVDMASYDDTAFQRFMQQSHTEQNTATTAQLRTGQRLQAYFQDMQEDATIKVRFRGMYSTEGRTPVDCYRLDGRNRHCESCGGDPHTSNGAGILQLGDDAFIYRCLAGRGGELTRFSLGSEAPGHPSVRGEDAVPPDVQVQGSVQASPGCAEASMPPEAQVHDDSDYKGRLPSFRTISEKIILACAGMASGKTYRASEFVEKGPEKPLGAGQETGREGKGKATGEDDPAEKTALSITARISMAETITGRFAHLGFVSYKDHEAVNSTEGRRRMVCEYESLDRLVKEPAVDILIIDEARAVMKAVTTYETNGDQLIPNYEMLLRQARRCGKLIVMCADLNLDLAVETFINDVLQVGGQQAFPGQYLRLRGPNAKPNAQLGEETVMFPPPPPTASVRRINVAKPILERTFVQTPLATAERMMVSDIRKERKVIGCFGSKSFMDATAANVKAEFPDVRIRAYGADSPHKAELCDIETHWAEFDVIFYTSTITCALDFNQPVYRVYLFPDMFTATPRDMLQMAGRARDVVDGYIVLALPKRRKKKEGESKRPPQTYFFPLPRNHDMAAVTEAEVAKIMASRDAKTPMMVQMRNRFHEDCNSERIKYLPDNMTKIWACNLAEETLKAKVWYPLFLWMVRKKGYKYRRVNREEEAMVGIDSEEEEVDGEGDDASDDDPLEQFRVFSAADMKEAEKKMMAGIDVTSFTRNDEKHLLARKIHGVAQQTDIVALKKYGVQKHFRDELTVDEIYTVLRKKRAILNACSMIKLSVEERADFFLVDAQGKDETDFLQSDYLVLRHMDRLLRGLGYSGLSDRTKSVDLMALNAKPQARETSQETRDDEDVAELAEDVDDMELAGAQETTQDGRDAARERAEDVARQLEVIRKIRRKVRIRGKKDSTLTEMKGILKNLIGIRFEGERGPRPERVVEHKMQEIDDIWRIAKMENDFFDAKWKVAMAVRVADLRKSSKRKRKKKTKKVDGVQQLLAGRRDEIWEW